MKWNIYNRSLLYAFILVSSLILILYLFFPDSSIFSERRVIIFYFISVIIAYMIIVLAIKKSFTIIAKSAWQKTNTSLLEKAEQQNIELALFEDRENYRREFLGNVSHELKTPLFAIQGYILTLLDGAMKDKTIRQKYLERIDKSVERLIYIVQDLDMLAALESGNLKMNSQVFNIKNLTLEVFELLEINAEIRGVELILEAPVPPTMIKADKERIQQVLMNLISNAINYSKVENPQVKVIIEPLDTSVKIQVEDNGLGIPAEHLPRIFERFYRIDSARSREDGGSGLGLAIVKNILEAHGEKISIESEPQKGSLFSFQLPKPD